MTLDTRIYVHGPVDHREAFVTFNRLIGADEGTRFSDEQDKTYRAGESFTLPDNPWTLMNEPMQGLPGWLMLHYRPGAHHFVGVKKSPGGFLQGESAVN